MLTYLPAISAKENPDAIAMAAEIANWTKKFENLRKRMFVLTPCFKNSRNRAHLCPSRSTAGHYYSLPVK